MSKDSEEKRRTPDMERAKKEKEQWGRLKGERRKLMRDLEEAKKNLDK